LESLVLLHFSIKVQNVNESRLLAGKDGADLRLEQTQLAIVDGARAIDGDADFADALTNDARQVKTCPDMATVGTSPAVVGRNRLLPGTA
jgi:hypothetical protein